MIRGTHSTFISNGINGELLLCWWGPECDIVVVCVIFIEDVQLQAMFVNAAAKHEQPRNNHGSGLECVRAIDRLIESACERACVSACVHVSCKH